MKFVNVKVVQHALLSRYMRHYSNIILEYTKVDDIVHAGPNAILL